MSEVWDAIVEFFDQYPWLEALAIVLLFVVLGRLVDRLLTGFVRRFVERSDNEIDDKLVELTHRPIFATVALIGVLIATYRLDLVTEAQRTIVLSVQTILVIIWVFFGLRFSRWLIGRLGRHPDRYPMVQNSTEPVLTNAATFLLVVGAIYAILLIWDINITPFLASGVVVGLALSLAAQDTLSNLFAGIAILSDRPYEIGDFIILDTGERGMVTRIGLRSTRLLTRDDVEVSIPNAVMGATKIVNEAGGPPLRYRIRTGVGVAYGSDVDQVVDVLTDIAQAHGKILADPQPRARFRAFGDSSLDFELLCWIEDPADRGLVLHELNSEIYRRFMAHGIQIPFPQQDIYIKEAPSQEGR